jgi:hypothetical protein
MNDAIIAIENKLKIQVDHVVNIHNEDMLKSKIFDLAFEWYMKGLQTGIECERLEQQKE